MVIQRSQFVDDFALTGSVRIACLSSFPNGFSFFCLCLIWQLIEDGMARMRGFFKGSDCCETWNHCGSKIGHGTQ
jgi:hypothetical protein